MELYEMKEVTIAVTKSLKLEQYLDCLTNTFTDKSEHFYNTTIRKQNRNKYLESTYNRRFFMFDWWKKNQNSKESEPGWN